jgi:NAD(P)-dependent dehydrogenase (short-subunit alcohol dehydrogenase family)
MNFEDLELGQGDFDGSAAYMQSKVAVILFTRELARRLEGRSVTANAVAPGWVATGLSRNSGAFSRFIMNMMASKPAKGAMTSIHVATAPELENITGRYFDQSQVKESSQESNDMEKALKLWEILEKQTGIAKS